MRIALAQINTTVADFKGNTEAVEQALARARAEGVDLVVFPEQTLPGYPAEDLLERPDFWVAADEALERVVASCHGVAALVGSLRRAGSGEGNPIHNAAFLIDDGEIVAAYDKRLLPTYDVFDEGRYFRPGRESAVVELRGHKVGLAVCEDLWNDPSFWCERRYDVDPIEDLARAGAEVIVAVSASPYSLGRTSLRYDMLRSSAAKHGIAIAMTNLVGGNTTLVFDGASFAVNANGDPVAIAPSFEEAVEIFDLGGEPLSDVPRSFTAGSARDDSALVEEVYRALVLGVRDYMEKSGFERAVLGLSGGIDSALTAAVAVDAIGHDRVLGVSLPSRYSSEGSIADAEALARNLGIEHHTLSIEDLFSSSLRTLEPLFEGTDPGIAEENIQARARGLLLMAISNKFGSLLLTTGNKSELAVGYCTLYGDMSGGLAVISDVPKTLVYRICEWLNREREIIPASTIEKPPSAELRPDQTDQDSLPPYDILDSILECYVEEHESADEIVARGFERTVVEDVIRLVDRNEYKRKQAAPGLRITSKAFGPGRRVPIVQRFRRV